MKSLYTIPDNQALRFIDGENGFIIPIERKRRMILSALPPNGQAACRLFYDAEAKKLLDEADGPSELKNLERIYSAYFITSVGDNAADRLGDLYFEAGRFDRAADCWLAILRDRPDTDLSPALITVKAAVALFRAGRQSELEQVRADLVNRYADEKLTIGGRTAGRRPLLQGLLDDAKASDADRSASHAERWDRSSAGRFAPAWQMRFAESVEAGMTPQELTQWETNPLSIAVPAVTIEGSTLFVNYLGFYFALDLKSGKMLCARRPSITSMSSACSNRPDSSIQPIRDPRLRRTPLVPGTGHEGPEFHGPVPPDLPSGRNGRGHLEIEGPGRLRHVRPRSAADPGRRQALHPGQVRANPQPRQGQPQQFVLAIQPHDGKLLWKTEVGLFRQGQQRNVLLPIRSAGNDPPAAAPLPGRGRLYVDTHPASWDDSTPTPDSSTGATATNRRLPVAVAVLLIGSSAQEPMPAGSPPVESGEAFLIKGSQSDRLLCDRARTG